MLLALLLPELLLRACFEILGRSAIFKIEGVDQQGLTEEEKAGLLEEILSISERNFGHNRTYVANEKYPQLSKYLFAYTEGVVLETGAKHSRVLSDANLKKNVKSLADMQHGAASSSSAGAPEATKSEGFAASEQKLKDLGTSRTKLSKNLEDLQLLIAEVELKGAEDSSWVKKGEEAEAAKTFLEVFLGTVRLQLAKKPPTDRTDACEDFLASLTTLLEQSAVHEVGSKSIIKSTKALLA